ncbi:MAG: 3'(2'),5'-bisphosphate nucleotidase [Candidatus Hydrogenedentes bacterium]|nr:3'(2'),5'-bisphosphate nucleotidase [Candidatus Hydrogenedentota bacterium]
MIDTTNPEVELALKVVGQGAAMAQRVLATMAVQNLTKSDFSPVTVGDFASQALAAHALQAAFPGVPLVGEESADDLRTAEGAEMGKLVADFVSKVLPETSVDAVCDFIDYGTADPTDRFWTIDPIDGTKGYLRGGQYAVALALIEKGEVQLGVLGCPNLGDNCQPDMGLGATIIAKRGEGTWLSVAGEEFTRLKVSECEDIAQARVMRSVEDSHTNSGQIDAIDEVLGVRAEPVRMDSQAKYAVLAAGGGELLFRLLNPGRTDYKECIWDQAAGSIVLEEAGGKITDLKGQPLDFARGRKLTNNTGVFASNGKLHAAGLAAIAEVCSLD